MTAYSPNTLGICTINCAQISVANCVSCRTTTSCQGCATGYVLAQGGALCQLVCTDANCNLCPSSASVCTTCKTGYALTTTNGVTSCVAAFCTIQYCGVCASVSTCSSCISGFSLGSGNTTCVSNCPGSGFSNCLLCTATACTVCNANYVLSSGSCALPCAATAGANCVACLSGTLCASCASGYALAPDYSTCRMVCIVRGCLTCPSTTSLNCTTCEAGYVSYTEFGTNLLKCSLSCATGTVPVTSGGTTTCTSCSTAVSFCTTCSAIAGGSIICSACNSGYFLNAGGCTACSVPLSNCLLCSSASRCNECALNFFNINGICDSGACASTVTNCIACLSSANTACRICKPGYNLNAGACVIANCPTTYILDIVAGACVCPTSTYETTVSSTKTCLPCSDKCTNCTGTVCYSCSVGFYAVGSVCNKCSANCEACTSASACNTCATGYSLEGGLCVSFGAGNSGTKSADGTVVLCEAGCDACQVSSAAAGGTICTKPAFGYALTEGVVKKCHPTCLTCASHLATLCTNCFPGTALKSGTCVSCTDPHALFCSSLDAAYSTECVTGYTTTIAAGQTLGVCRACSQFCLICFSNGPGNCDSNGCSAGYVQLTGTMNCTKCFGGCTTCSASNPNTCFECGNKRYLTTSGTCASCPTGC